MSIDFRYEGHNQEKEFDGIPKINENGNNLTELANAIELSRTAAGGDVDPSLTFNLPGGKSVLGQDGVENKVVLKLQAIYLTADNFCQFYNYVINLMNHYLSIAAAERYHHNSRSWLHGED
jgi:hypothetical protein